MPQSSTSFFALGSRITLTLAAAGPTADDILRAARRRFLDWEQQFSRFRQDSELCRLNRGEISVPGPALRAVLRAALRGARETEGLVNPGMLAALENAGYDRSFEAIQRESRSIPAASLLAPAAWRAIRLERGGAVSLPPGLRLDLGGYAKGWAADRTARRLGRRFPVLVDAGGDIAAGGALPEGRPWQIAVAGLQPGEPPLARLELSGGGVATSGRLLRAWQQEGRPRHHLIDPRSGQPAAGDVLAATVSAPSALEAEIAAKALVILGSRAGIEWLNARPRLAAILALEDGALWVSPALKVIK